MSAPNDEAIEEIARRRMENSNETFEEAVAAVRAIFDAPVYPAAGEVTCLWYLSFADSTAFLGFVIAETGPRANVGTISIECHRRRCNPGGSVVAVSLSEMPDVDQVREWLDTIPRWTLLGKDRLPERWKKVSKS